MNKYTITSDINRALTGRGFLAGVLGMVLVIVLSALEPIIKMIRPRRKSKLAFTIAMVLALMMIMTCFITACQRTPEE